MKKRHDLSFLNDEPKRKATPVIEFESNLVFDSMSKAAKHFGINVSKVALSCKTSRAVGNGLKFSYWD